MRNRDFMMIDGQNSMEYGIWLFGNDEYNFPQRDVEMVSVPGRSGDLTIDKDRFKNIKVKYSCVMFDNRGKNLDAFRAFLLMGSGYRRIETTFDPDHYRMGIYTGETKPKQSREKDVATFQITFDCKPQRYFKVGEEFKEYADGDIIHNPTLYVSKPLIRVYGNGQFTVGSRTVKVVNNDSYIDIDCELQDCYHGVQNLNDHVELLSGKFPEIGIGNIEVRLNGVSKLEMQCRWWTI